MMGFFKKLFGFTVKEKDEIPAKIQQNKSEFAAQKSEFNILLSELKEIGHPENPLFRKEYALSSAIPCKDFSGWIIDKLSTKKHKEIHLFMHHLTSNNFIGVTISDGEEKPKNYLRQIEKKLDNFLLKNISDFITIEIQAVYEIQSFFILMGLDSDREFWIAQEKEAELLSRILCVYDFTVNIDNLKPLVHKANKFLKEMKADELTDYWENYPLYNTKSIKPTYILNNNLKHSLKKLSISARLNFFDYCNSPYWDRSSGYRVRAFGINEIDCALEMINSGLYGFLSESDFKSALKFINKSELKDMAENKGFEIKKTWTLEKIYDNLIKTDDGKQFISSFLKEKCVLKITPSYQELVSELLEYKQQIRVIADLLSMI